MKRVLIPMIVALISSTGCTTVALNNYTLAQVESSGRVRDELVLKCLASVCADPESLPSFAVYASGTTQVTDTVSVGQSVTWAPLKYTIEALQLTGSQTPNVQWTIHPLVAYEQLEAVHAACLWARYGPEPAMEHYPTILGDQKDYLDDKPHFGVQNRLSKIPHGWVHCGSHAEVPACARFKGHHGKTWVWVMPEDSEAFSQFTLVLQDISTLDISGGYGTPLIVTLTSYDVTKLPDSVDASKAATISTTEDRMIKKEYRQLVDKAIQESVVSGKPVNLTRAQWLKYSDPWFGLRTTPVANSLASRTPQNQLTVTGGGASGSTSPTGVPPALFPKATFELEK